MLNSGDHLSQAGRFTSFLSSLSPEQPYKEWLLVLWFYIALHYVEAFLVTVRPRLRTHESRREDMRQFPETRAILNEYQQLYKLSKEARYDGTPFTQADIDRFRPLYLKVVAHMKATLGI
jgi:hypothetical protein